MTSNSRKQEVYQVMATVLGVREELLTDDSGPDSIASWDSLTHVTLVLALEEHFEVVFSDDDVTDMLSVGLVCRIIEEKLPGTKSPSS